MTVATNSSAHRARAVAFEVTRSGTKQTTKPNRAVAQAAENSSHALRGGEPSAVGRVGVCMIFRPSLPFERSADKAVERKEKADADPKCTRGPL